VSHIERQLLRTGVPMLDFSDGTTGQGFSAAILWTLAALVALALVLFIVKTIRRMTFGTFVAGGRNRKTRLAVMDATAVDSHRRLVLVRRDDIEHLLLIGGPTDVVVERDIRLAGPRRAATPGASQPSGPSRPAQQPARQGGVHSQQAPAQQGLAPRPVAPPAPQAPAPQAPVQQTPTQQPHRHANPPMARPAGTAHGEAHRLPAAGSEPLDDSLASELAVSLGEEGSAAGKAAATRPESVDEEMARLLNEFSTKR
jgi:hypothetical protein